MTNVFVWTVGDVLALGFLAILAVMFVGLIAAAYVQDKYRAWKKRRTT